jgi:hypothetical protein
MDSTAPAIAVGDSVNFVHDDGTILPAVITRASDPVCLCVLQDGLNSGLGQNAPPAKWVPSVRQSDGKEPGTWHRKAVAGEGHLAALTARVTALEAHLKALAAAAFSAGAPAADPAAAAAPANGAAPAAGA